MMEEIEVWQSAVDSWRLHVEQARNALEVAENNLCYYGLKLALVQERRQLDHQLALEGTEYLEEQLTREITGD